MDRLCVKVLWSLWMPGKTSVIKEHLESHFPDICFQHFPLLCLLIYKINIARFCPISIRKVECYFSIVGVLREERAGGNHGSSSGLGQFFLQEAVFTFLSFSKRGGWVTHRHVLLQLPPLVCGWSLLLVALGTAREFWGGRRCISFMYCIAVTKYCEMGVHKVGGCKM